MAAIRFSAPLLLVASAASAAYVQVPLYWPNPEAFAALAATLKEVEYPNAPFSGIIPWYTYAMDVNVGTPGQRQSVVLSFENEDSYIIWEGQCLERASGDTSSPPFGCSSGLFDDEKSETFSYNSSATTYTSYVGGYSAGYLMYDDVAIGDTTLRNATLELSTETHLDAGIFGLANSKGYRSPYFRRGGQEPVVMLDQMTTQGLIDSPAFSIWAHDGDNGTTGSIVFGAVDKSRYEGKLQRIQASYALDMYARDNVRRSQVEYEHGYFVNVSAAWYQQNEDDEQSDPYMNYEKGASSVLDPSGPFYAAIDPTYTFTNVPKHIIEPLLYDIKPSFWHNILMYTIDCNKTDSLNGSLTLELGGEGGYRLSANLRDLVISGEDWFLDRHSNEGDDAAEEDEGRNYCLLALQSSERGEYGTSYQNSRSGATQWVIGSKFLENTYTVFDSKNMEVGLAPLKSNPGDRTDIVSFEKLGARIPDSDFVGFEECFDRCEAEEDEDDEDAGVSLSPSRNILGLLMIGALGALTW